MPVRLVLHVIFTFSVKQVNLPTNRSVVKAEPPKKESAAPPEVKPGVKQAPAAGDKPAQKSEKPDKKEKKDKKKPAAEGGKDFCRLTVFIFWYFFLYGLKYYTQFALVMYSSRLFYFQVLKF